jgi:hypothetical protein
LKCCADAGMANHAKKIRTATLLQETVLRNIELSFGVNY